MGIETPKASEAEKKYNGVVIAKSGFKPNPEDHSHDGVDNKYLAEYKTTALKEMEDDLYQRMTEATSADEIERLNNELKKTQESVAKDNEKIEKLTSQEQKDYQQYKIDDAKKAGFVKNGVPNTTIEEAAQENLNKATHELDEVGAQMADLQTEKNLQASKHDSEAIAKITAQLKGLEKKQADLAQNQWEADWGINESNQEKEKIAKMEESRTLSDAELLNGNAEYDKEKGNRLELTNEQIEAARVEMSKNLEERMEGNQSSVLSPEEIAKIGKERKIIEAELIKHGAKYIIGKNGEKQLVLTEDQIRQANNEMKKSLEAAAKESTNKKIEDKHPAVETTKKESEGTGSSNVAPKKEIQKKDTENKTAESKTRKATKWKLPVWIVTLLEGIGGIALIAFGALFGSLEKQVGKKKK